MIILSMSQPCFAMELSVCHITGSDKGANTMHAAGVCRPAWVNTTVLGVWSRLLAMKFRKTTFSKISLSFALTPREYTIYLIRQPLRVSIDLFHRTFADGVAVRCL